MSSRSNGLDAKSVGRWSSPGLFLEGLLLVSGTPGPCLLRFRDTNSWAWTQLHRGDLAFCLLFRRA